MIDHSRYSPSQAIVSPGCFFGKLGIDFVLEASLDDFVSAKAGGGKVRARHDEMSARRRFNITSVIDRGLEAGLLLSIGMR